MSSLSQLFCYDQTNINVVFEILTAVVMKCLIFGDITLCSRFKVNRRFERTCGLQLQIEEYAKQKTSACYVLHIGFLLAIVFDPEAGGKMFF